MEFVKKSHKPKYLYIFRVGNYYFDLTESMAKEIMKESNLKLQIYPSGNVDNE